MGFVTTVAPASVTIDLPGVTDGSILWDNADTVAGFGNYDGATTVTLTGFTVVAGIFNPAAGSAAAPSVTFTGDPDSGLYSGGADIVGLAIAGAANVTFHQSTLQLSDDQSLTWLSNNVSDIGISEGSASPRTIYAGTSVEAPTLAASTAINATYATASTVPYLDASKNLISSLVTPTELGYLDGVTSALQTQLDAKVIAITSTDNAVARYNSTAGQVQDSGVIVDDSDNVTGINDLTIDGDLVVSGQAASSQDTETQAASAAHTIDFADGNSTVWDLQAATGNVTLTLSNPVAGASYIIKIIQSSTARTVTWPAAVLWPGGTAPTITATTDAIDIVSLYYDGTNYLANFNQAYA